jgi:hypothetical protein
MSRYLQSKSNQFELARIRWRVWTMGLPGGVELLLVLCRKVKFKEQRVRASS